MARVRSLLVLILFGVIVIFAGGVTSAHTISCGDVLGPGGNFQLQQDLDCSSPPRSGLTVTDGAILDLNGHIVTCAIFSPVCVVLSGVGAQLFDGVVEGALADLSVLVIGDNNRLINVMATSVLHSAFSISGNNNQLSDSIAQCIRVEHGCIEVSGDRNRLTDNFATNEGQGARPDIQAGLFIGGNYNLVRRNRTISRDRSSNGIVVTGTNNDIRHNTALENSPFDLRDTNGNCAHNTWKFNTFRTADPGCIQ